MTKLKLAGGLTGLAGLAIGSILLIPAAPPVQWFDSVRFCGADQPSHDRVFGSRSQQWGADEFIAVLHGNETKWYRWTGSAMQIKSGSAFNVPNVGDSDYDLYNISVCDDCRYGVANYKAGTVLFQLGTSSYPRPGAHNINSDANAMPGAYTFGHGAGQYLVAESYDSQCTGSSLYAFDDVVSPTWLACIDPGTFGDAPALEAALAHEILESAPDYQADMEIKDGEPVELPDATLTVASIVAGDRAGDYLYLGDKNQAVRIYHIEGSGQATRLVYVGSLGSAYGIKDFALQVDPVAGLMAVGHGTQGTKLYDVSDPGAPALRSTITGYSNRVSLRYPLLFTARKGFKYSERTFDVSNPAAPVEIQSDFWDSEHDWNHADDCARQEAARITRDGRGLVRMMFSVGQTVDVSGWAAPPVPTPTPTPDPSVALIFDDGFEDGRGCAWKGWAE